MASSIPSVRSGAKVGIGSRVVFAALVVIAVLAAGEAVRRTMAHRYEERDPALALAWEPSDVAARENLANRSLSLALTPSSPSDRSAALMEAEATAKRALAQGPLHWAALRDIGIAKDSAGRHDEALSIMTRADLRGRRDIATEGWWLQRSLAAGDAPGAVARMDALLRSEPDLEPRLFPVMMALLSAPGGRQAWGHSLVINPPWREAALDQFAHQGQDVDAVAGLFSDLAALRSPPSDDQVGGLLTRIAIQGRYAEARALWERSLRPALPGPGIPYDGAFTKRPGSAPFNWKIYQPGSGAAQMERRPGVGSALVATYPSSTAPVIAEQLLTLAPGAYQLTGRWRIDEAAAGAETGWILTCANTGATIGHWRHATDVRVDWSGFQLAFAVPNDCPGQWLRLLGRAGDGFGELSTAFTSLKFTPTGTK